MSGSDLEYLSDDDDGTNQRTKWKMPSSDYGPEIQWKMCKVINIFRLRKVTPEEIEENRQEFLRKQEEEQREWEARVNQEIGLSAIPDGRMHEGAA